jgi:hypothetical protein
MPTDSAYNCCIATPHISLNKAFFLLWDVSLSLSLSPSVSSLICYLDLLKKFLKVIFKVKFLRRFLNERQMKSFSFLFLHSVSIILFFELKFMFESKRSDCIDCDDNQIINDNKANIMFWINETSIKLLIYTIIIL